MRVLAMAIAVAIGALVPLASALANVEGVLDVDSFKFSSPGRGSSGPVVVYGSRRGDAVTELCVVAFEKTQCLAGIDLAKLKGRIVNDIQLSYDVGPRDYGGRTVHVLLAKGFLSGREEAIVVSVGEFGVVRVHAPPEAS